MNHRTFLRAGVLPIAIALAVTVLTPLTADAGDESQWPPSPPQGDRRLSIDLRGPQAKLLKLVIEDRRVDRAIKYVVDLPGTPKLRMFRMRGEVRPTAADVKDYYLGWAAQHGYQMLVEAWNDEHSGLTGVLHKPGVEGGIFAYQVDGVDVLWLWNGGHAPIGPLLAAWFDYPTLKSESQPPEGTRPWHVRGDLPPIYNEHLDLRVEMDRWEIESIARDLEASRDQYRDHPNFPSVLAAAPEMLSTVRHIWFLTYGLEPGGERQALLAQWRQWGANLSLTSVAEGELDGTQFEFLIRSGEDGGLLLTMEDDRKAHLLVFDGGPHMAAVSDILEAAVRASQVEQ